MRTPTHFASRLISPALALGASLAIGCSSGPDDRLGYDPENPIDNSRALLSRADTCDDLLTSIREDAYAKIEIQTQQYLEWYTNEDRGGPTRGGAEPDAGAEAPSDDSAGSDSPDEYSETNTQVEGVDEADIVKTDGEHIYVVSENELIVVDSWPAEETHVLARFTVEGYPYEMFVADGRAVVFSQTMDPRLSPDEARCDDHYADYGYYYPCYSGGTQFTKITVVDLGPEASAPTLEREAFVEGHYRSSRRHEAQVRAVINNWGYYFGWQLPSVYEYLYREEDGSRELTPEMARARIYEWRRDALDAVDDKPLEDWLPDMLERKDGEISDVPVACDDFYVTRPGLAEYGMTQIAGIDMADGDEPLTRTGIWGSAQELYANHETMVLAQADYSAYYRAYLEESEVISVSTVLHRFGLDADGGVSYEASGFVPGTIVDQFSIDERDGIIRIATTENPWVPWWAWEDGEDWEPPQSQNYVFTVERDGNELSILGSTEPLAAGERIFSTRFMGDLGYVVTFRQVDPLFAIDLSDPANPEVLGELKIPGFSNYMHPLGEDHLLTIGRDATDEGMVEGLALQIFDVSNPTAPKLAHKHVFTDEWGYSNANWDHKAFTYFGARELLAFPYVAYGDDWRSFRSSLEVFHVNAEEGFRKVGSIDHSGLLESECEEDNYYCRDWGLSIRRGVFIEDYVYSISYGGVRVNDARDMTELATVPF